MGSAAIRPSVLVGRLLRKKRKERSLTLREVSEWTAGRGDRIPTSTLVRIEQGKLDPGVRRLHLLLDLYRVPPHLVNDLVQLETLAVPPPPVQDLETLYKEGIEYWKQGNLGEGLARLFALREHVPADAAARKLRQKGTLAFAIAARNLGKFQLAKQLVDDLLCEPPDPGLVVHVLVLAASLWRGLGSHEMAVAAVRQARAHVAPDDPAQLAMVLHQEAKLHNENGNPAAAEGLLRQALRLLRSTGDSYGEARARILQIAVHERSGRPDAALRAARDAARFAREHRHEAVEIHARLELGRLLGARDVPRQALEVLRDVLGNAVERGDRNTQFLAHYHLWKLLERLGEREAARFERSAACYFVDFVDDLTPEAEELRALAAAPDGSAGEP